MLINKAEIKYRLKKWAKVISIDLAIIGVILCLFWIIKPWFQPSIKINGIYIENPKNIHDFSLISKAQLQGHWTLLFFGFTHCPVICPSAFDALNKMQMILETKLNKDSLPQVIFVSIDPERDTPARLNAFINSYNSNFIGIGADANKIKNIEQDFSIKVKNENGNFIHNTEIILLNPNAQIQAYFPYPHNAESMARDYMKIIGK